MQSIIHILQLRILSLAIFVFYLKVLSDETKRKEYDSWGATSEQMGMGAPPPGGRQQGFSSQNWQFSSNIDPEELFRKIFGEAGFNSNNFGEDFSESKYGFGAAQEVSENDQIAQTNPLGLKNWKSIY